MGPLSFERFIPRLVRQKDFSGLEDAIISSRPYAIESADSVCVIVRGSIVSAFDSKIQRAHPNSDIDLIVVSKRPHKFTNQYLETVRTGKDEIRISMDATNLNLGDLEREVHALGTSGVSSLFDFAQDCHPISNIAAYSHYRATALKAFLRFGLGYYSNPTYVTPSGAMKAINQGKLLVNPLRWWSIEYAFQISDTAEQNISRYYEDVAAMLSENFCKVGKHGNEDMYKLPQDFALEVSPLFKLNHLFDKIKMRLYSTPMVSTNDISKVRNKLKSLIVGIIEGKTDIDTIFGNYNSQAGILNPGS